jgi:hypothetical protein
MRLLAVGWFALAASAACLAQQFEIGATGGVGVYKNVTVTHAGQNGSAGFKPGVAFGVFAAQDLYEHLGGELRYMFQFDDLKVSSGGTEETFSGQSHAIHYNLQLMAGHRESPVRPYASAGGGVKVYRGTGAQHAEQPLGQFAALTHTQEIKGLITFGGGVRVKVGKRTFLYAEALDYLTPFPTQVVAPVPPSKLSGWLHDFVPMLSLSIRF